MIIHFNILEILKTMLEWAWGFVWGIFTMIINIVKDLIFR